MPRQMVNSTTLVERPPPMQASDQATIPPSITFFEPKRSTRMPDMGYMMA